VQDEKTNKGEFDLQNRLKRISIYII
jgi:hypothetical protein